MFKSTKWLTESTRKLPTVLWRAWVLQRESAKWRISCRTRYRKINVFSPKFRPKVGVWLVHPSGLFMGEYGTHIPGSSQYNFAVPGSCPLCHGFHSSPSTSCLISKTKPGMSHYRQTTFHRCEQYTAQILFHIVWHATLQANDIASCEFQLKFSFTLF